MSSSEEPRPQSIFREYYESLIIVAIFVTFARIFVFQTFKIPTPSMVDNLLVGDHIIVNKFIDGAAQQPWMLRLLPFRDIQREDIAVFRFPLDRDTDYVKRVIGLPGDTIVIRDKQVFVNGRKLAQRYALFQDPQVYPSLEGLPEQFRSRDQFGPFVVPADQYFMMGDNRDASYDSRFWGTVPRELIKGKPLLVYWSFRGQPALPGSPPGARISELIGVVIHFFSNTRWDRTLFIVDSHYHYHPEPDDGSGRHYEQ